VAGEFVVSEAVIGAVFMNPNFLFAFDAGGEDENGKAEE